MSTFFRASLSQVDDHGHMHMMLDEIEDHRVLNDAVMVDYHKAT